MAIIIEGDLSFHDRFLFFSINIELLCLTLCNVTLTCS